jgi:nucleotide-binding universal stress UspA family protein
MTDNMLQNITVRRFDAEFLKLGLTVPAAIAEARANKARVRDLTAPEVDITPAAEALVDGRDPGRALQATAAASLYGQALRAARGITEVRSWEAVMRERETILATLRDKVHAPAIKRLTEISQHISPSASIESYMENREADKAGYIMEAEDLTKRLASAYTLRRELYTETSSSSLFKGTAAFVREINGLAALHGYAPANWREWITLMQSGVTPWFPLWDEYLALKAQHDGAPERKAKAKQEAQVAERRANSPRPTEAESTNRMVAL